MRTKTEFDQCVDVRIRGDNDVATLAAITAIGAALCIALQAKHVHTTIATLSRADQDDCGINEHE